MKRNCDYFGFTKDLERVAIAKKWREDAIADGWSHRPTYPGDEAEERACTLGWDGFKASTVIRPAEGPGCRHHVQINVWGPDGLAIEPGTVYSMEHLTKGLRRCNYCGAENVDTERVSFAGRCCTACLEGQRKKLEYPGWTS